MQQFNIQICEVFLSFNIYFNSLLLWLGIVKVSAKMLGWNQSQLSYSISIWEPHWIGTHQVLFYDQHRLCNRMSNCLPNRAQYLFSHSSHELLFRIKGVTHAKQPTITVFCTRGQIFLTAFKKINLCFWVARCEYSYLRPWSRKALKHMLNFYHAFKWFAGLGP